MPNGDVRIERPGILCKEHLRLLINERRIKNFPKNRIDEDIDLSSFDLHIGNSYWKIPGGFKGRSNKSINEIISSLISRGIIPRENIGQLTKSGLEIKKEETYLFKIKETMDLEDNFIAQGTGKSSIGRLDILTRLLVDNEEKYDSVKSGERNLFVEVTPLSFSIKVYPNMPIYQLRIAYGGFDKLRIDTDLLKLYKANLKDENGEPLEGEEQSHLRLNLNPDTTHGGFQNGIIAYRAKDTSTIPIDLNSPPQTYNPFDYWEPIEPSLYIDDKPAILIEKGRFYILRSRERFILPDNIAVYGVAMTEEIGELRIHYAGFVHPMFGEGRVDGIGAPLIFEVRGHDVDMYLMHGDLMAELKYFPMSKPTIREENQSYSNQELTLSKIFKPWNNGN